MRKDIAETIEKLMTFIEGINVKGTATLNEIMLLKDLVSENFQPEAQVSASTGTRTATTISTSTLWTSGRS